jgi:hypothetical protein
MLKPKDKFCCPYVGCQISYDNMLSLSHHWSRAHKLSQKDLYLTLNNFKQEPTCKCGCGEEVKFLGSVKGFCEYKRGHISRVANNFQTEKSVTNSKATRKRMHQAGEIKIWNSGLTKETDKRLEDLGNKTREWLERCPEERIKKSERMKRQRREGITVSPSGPESGGWKGGISPLSIVCRANTSLFRNWTRKHMERTRFSCEKCGKDKTQLEVHHDKETFAEILHKFANQFKWVENVSLSVGDIESNPELYDLKYEISDAVAEYHITNNVSGLVLCKTCHKDLHQSHNL